MNEGTYTPGAAYYVDGTLDLDAGKFNASRLSELSKKFTTVFADFTNVEVGMDLTGSGYSLGDTGTPSEQMTAIVSKPQDLFAHIANRFVNTKSGHAQSKVSSDPLSAVYAEARNDTKLRALLFLLTLARIGRTAPDGPSIWDVVGQVFASVATLGLADPFLAAGDIKEYCHTSATVLADSIVERIEKKLVKAIGSSPISSAPAGSSDVAFAFDTMHDALVKGTTLTDSIDAAFVSVLDAFVGDGRATITSADAFNEAIKRGATIAQANSDRPCRL
jgi:hypothetical protein